MNNPTKLWRLRDITLSQSLSKNYKVMTRQPITEENWQDICNNNDILMPDKLIQKAGTLLSRLYNLTPTDERHEIKWVIDQLDNWTTDDQCCAW